MPSPWLFAALLLLSLAALAVLVRAQLRVLRSARLAAAPLRARQEVVFEEAGPVVLCLEGPRFTPGFRRLEFELGLPGGAPVEKHRILFRLVTSGLATARISLLRFALPYAGRYVLEIRGLDPRQEAGAPDHTVVFMRPHTARAVLFAAGMTLAGGLAVVSLVFLLLAFVPTAGAIDPGRVSGHVAIDGERIELHQAYAHLHPNAEGRLPFTPELRIVLADREVPQESLRGLDALPVLDLARAGRVRGLLLRLAPGDPGTVVLVVLDAQRPTGLRARSHRYSAADGRIITNLALSRQRVGGDIHCPVAQGIECAAHFSAPLFSE